MFVVLRFLGVAGFEGDQGLGIVVLSLLIGTALGLVALLQYQKLPSAAEVREMEAGGAE